MKGGATDTSEQHLSWSLPLLWGRLVGVYLDKRSISSNAKELRKTMTDAERLLWKYLRSKQLSGIKFRRQEPIGNYIADFVSFERRMVIEVDGGYHSDQKVKDQERDAWFTGQGFLVLRFWNHEVLQNIEAVVVKIADTAATLPNPSHEREGLRS